MAKKKTTPKRRRTSTPRRSSNSSSSSLLPFLLLGGGLLAFSSFSGGTATAGGGGDDNLNTQSPPDYATEPDKWRAFVEQLIAIGGTVAAIVKAFKNGGKSPEESAELLNIMNARFGQSFNLGNNPWTNQTDGAGFPFQSSGLSFNNSNFPGSGIPGGSFGNNTLPNGGFGGFGWPFGG